jgi:1-acyl-sn-glycerol-3-phosphate acyltransferase
LENKPQPLEDVEDVNGVNDAIDIKDVGEIDDTNDTPHTTGAVGRALHSLQGVTAWGVTATNTAAIASAAIGLSAVDPGGFRTYHLGRFWSQLNLRLLRTPLEVVGRDNVVRGQPYVAMVNHNSHVDIWAVYAALPLSIRWVMKQELRRVPIFGYCCERMGHLYVERGNSDSARRSMEQAAESIATGTTVVFFPEGTRSRDGELRSFKTGGFRLALQAQVPVLPVGIHGTRQMLPAGEWRPRRGHIRVAIEPPIQTEGLGLDSLHLLMEQTREAIERGRERARRLS